MSPMGVPIVTPDSMPDWRYTESDSLRCPGQLGAEASGTYGRGERRLAGTTAGELHLHVLVREGHALAGRERGRRCEMRDAREGSRR